MEKLCYILFISFFLTSCSSGEKSADPSGEKNSLYSQAQPNQEFYQKDTAVTIDKIPHRIFYAAASGTHQKYRTGNPTRTGDGVSFYFTLRQDADTVWHKIFTEADFRLFVHNSLLKDTKINLPRFEAYLPDMKAFVFYVDFEYPNVNSGMSAVLIIGYNGYLVYKGGLTQEKGRVLLSPAKTEVLAFGEVIREDWTVRNISDTLYHAATIGINEQHVLVLLYDPQEEKSVLKLMTWRGEKIKALPYQGYYQANAQLHTPMYHDQISGNYFFLDKDNDQLVVIPSADPMLMHSLKLSEMKPFPAEKKQTDEIIFEITVRDSVHHFSVDPQTQLYRYQKP